MFTYTLNDLPRFVVLWIMTEYFASKTKNNMMWLCHRKKVWWMEALVDIHATLTVNTVVRVMTPTNNVCCFKPWRQYFQLSQAFPHLNEEVIVAYINHTLTIEVADQKKLIRVILTALWVVMMFAFWEKVMFVILR